MTRYRCFLPDLAGLAGLRRVGPGTRISLSLPGTVLHDACYPEERMPMPSSHEAVVAHYRDQLDAIARERQRLIGRRLRLRIFLVACVVLFLIAGLGPHLAQWLALVPALGFVASLPAYIGLQNALLRLVRLEVLHDGNVARADGTQTQSGHTGEEFHTSSHLYDHDLNVLGANSLFGLLATVRTGIGQSGLAHLLLTPAMREEILERQQSVQELASMTALREEIALLGTSRFEDASPKAFASWLDDPTPQFSASVPLALMAISVAVICMLLGGLVHRLPWSNVLALLAGCFAVQAAIFRVVRNRVLPVLEASRKSSQMQLFADAVELLLKQRFHSPQLLRLQQSFREPALALPALRRLESHFSMVEQMQKEYAFVLSILFSLGTQTAISIAKWKQSYADPMRGWSAQWGEFEALMAVANYAFEHPENGYPKLCTKDEPVQYRAAALGHPLLPAASCVRNEIALCDDTRFYLISGSNMAGKSTLLRAIGLNAVLAYAGAPVCAEALRLSVFALGASIAVTDSLADGRSKFLAEVERLSAILEGSRDKATLFLIDEVFSGTNSHDRRIAAEAVLRGLLRNKAIGAISTHDLVLTALATEENRGRNVHMASPDAENPLAFDFLLKPGINQASNALAIVRMMGIEPEA